MKHNTFLLGFILLATTTGCLKVQKKDELAKSFQAPQVQVQAINNRELHLDDVFVEFIGQQPDLYDMKFSWPETRDQVRVSINGQVAFTLNTSDQTSEELTSLQGGRKLSVFIEILDQESHVITSEVRELEVPKDYIFPKNLRLTHPMKVQAERVFLNGSIILTENHDLEIRTKKLIVLEKSYIQNYQYETKAKVGAVGRNGGSIYIEALVASGPLDITMNSEAGGDGYKGQETPPCMHNAGFGCHAGSVHCSAGSKGFAAGNNGHLFVKIKEAKDFQLYPQQQISLGGAKGPNMNEVTAPDYPLIQSGFVIKTSECARPKNGPHNGPNAQAGKICLLLSDLMSEADCQ